MIKFTFIETFFVANLLFTFSFIILRQAGVQRYKVIMIIGTDPSEDRKHQFFSRDVVDNPDGVDEPLAVEPG